MSTAEIPTRVVLGPGLAGTLMTPAEFDEVEEYDEDYAYELIHGVLVVSPTPAESERGPNEMLGYWLISYKEHHPQGAALDGTLPEHYIRTPTSRRRADRVIWAGLGRQPKPRRDPATIAVEFVSEGKRNRQRDYVEKRKEYLQTSLSEYWVVDRFRRQMTVYRRKRPQTIIVAESETYRTTLLPGFELHLAELLAIADRWED